MATAAIATVAVAATAAAVVSRRNKRPSSFSPAHLPALGKVSLYRLTSIVREEGPMVGGLTAFDAEPTSSEDVDFAEFMARQSVNNAVVYSYDLERRFLVFLCVDDRAALWAEPFLDRGVRKLANENVFVATFETAFAYARAADFEAGKTLNWVWNTGRCGSTLMSRVLCASGTTVSLSEPWWFDQLEMDLDKSDLTPKRKDVCSMEEYDELVWLLHVIDFELASDLWPSSTVFSMNPKGKGHPVIPSVLRKFPVSKHCFMYRDARKVVESFGSIFSRSMSPIASLFLRLGLAGPPPLSAESFVDPDLAERFRAGSLVLPELGNPIAKRIAVMWLDGVSTWLRLSQSESLLRDDSITLRMDEFTTRDLDARRRNVCAVLDWIGIGSGDKAVVDKALSAFNKHSQAGSKMATSSSSAGGAKFLDDAGREAVAAFVASVPGMSADMVIPGSLGT